MGSFAARYLSTNGRLPRSTFWGYWAGFLLISFVANALDRLGWGGDVFKVLFGLVVLMPYVLVGWIVEIKRWHDLNRSGWWVLINFVPLIGALVSFIVLGFVKGTDGPNRFGPDPLRR